MSLPKHAIPQDQAMCIDAPIVNGCDVYLDLRYTWWDLRTDTLEHFFHGVTEPLYDPMGRYMHRAANEPAK